MNDDLEQVANALSFPSSFPPSAFLKNLSCTVHTLQEKQEGNFLCYFIARFVEWQNLLYLSLKNLFGKLLQKLVIFLTEKKWWISVDTETFVYFELDVSCLLDSSAYSSFLGLVD